MNIIALGHVERAPLGDPCEVCGCRSHSRSYHGELGQRDGQVLTLEEWRLRDREPAGRTA